MNSSAVPPFTTPPAAEREVLLEKRGSAGVITFNRPRQLNALSHGMVKQIYPQMLAWREDASVTRIVIKAAGEKAFCAGGDIRALYDMGKAGRAQDALPFWREEYTLNHLLATYPKPVIALINGIVMGGGVGMSCHGSHRVGTEKLMFAMPEVSIGFFPDVGASYLLPRLKHHVGSYLAITGARIGLADAVDLGLVTHAVDSARITELEEALTNSEPVDDILAGFRIPVAPPGLAEHHGMIADIFSESTIPGIVTRLGHMALGGSLFASQALDAIHTKSPMSLAISLAQMQRGASMSFADAMAMEYRIVSRIIHGHDFYEGVRAVIIDKDNQPRWMPSRIEDVSDRMVETHFLPLDGELVLG